MLWRLVEFYLLEVLLQESRLIVIYIFLDEDKIPLKMKGALPRITIYTTDCYINQNWKNHVDSIVKFLLYFFLS